jgi:hypothetical protein
MTPHVLILATAVAAAAAATQQPTVPTFVVVDGCVAAENEIPGRTPNVAERAGVGEDYILTNAVMVKGKPPVELPDDTGGAVSNALRPMYELGGLTGDQLKPHLGHRVRIEGTFTNTNRDPHSGPLNDDLVELTGTSIRQVPGSCLPKKS